MKDGRTHLAHKLPSTRWTWRPERLWPSRCTGPTRGDTKTIQETVAEGAGERITSIVADTDHGEDVKQVSAEGPREVVTGHGKGYHSRRRWSAN